MNGPQLRTPDARAVGLSTLSTFCGKPPRESRTRSAGRRKIGPNPDPDPRAKPRCPPRSVDSFVTFPGRPEVRMGVATRMPSRQENWPASRPTGPQEPRTADCNEARGRLGPPTSGQSSRWGPASRGSANPAPMTLRPANVTAAPASNPDGKNAHRHQPGAALFHAGRLPSRGVFTPTFPHAAASEKDPAGFPSM